MHICRGLANSSELTVALYTRASQTVTVYAAIVNHDSMLSFEQKAVFDQVDAMESIDFSKV